jgi:L-alanine-DL-glutamate epimerase-like enolase superfamily enzyme
MKITAIEYLPHRMRRKVHWQTSSYSADSLQLFYVKLHTDEELTGIGAASIMPTRAATFEPGIEALRQGTRSFVGCDPRELDRLMDALDDIVPGFGHHKVAVEMALFDLKAKAQNISLAQLLGGRRYDTIPVLKMLGMGTTEWMAERAGQFVQQGYRHLKVKLGDSPELDCERFRAIRQSVGSAVTLTSDFNGAYDAATAITVINKLAADGLAMAEQPVAAADLDGMAKVAAAVKPLVLADQSVDRAEDVFEVAHRKAAGAVSIKLLKLGGIRRSLAVVKACEAVGLACHVGGTGSTRLVEAAQVHFISATPRILVPAEVAEFEELDDDLVQGLDVVNGAIRVPDGPGLGVVLKI